MWRPQPVRILLTLLAVALASACGASPTGPSGQPPPGPQPGAGPALFCPVTLEIESPTGLPVRVSFTPPVAQGGSDPVSVACTPGSGSELPPGTHPIACLATDAVARTASCSFNVVVSAVPRLTQTRFLAFGDSITFGRASAPVSRLFAVGPGESQSYPFKLLDQLRARYTQQTIILDNAGVPGETAAQGLNRLKPEIDSSRPGALLLMEGTNDLFFQPNDQGIEDTILALEGLVRTAEQRGVRVFLATIPPQRLGGRRDAVARLIPRFNDAVRVLAARRNATLVDIYAALASNVQLYIGIDDLHPTEEGYRVVANTFFAAIRTSLEQAPAGAGLRVR